MFILVDPSAQLNLAMAGFLQFLFSVHFFLVLFPLTNLISISNDETILSIENAKKNKSAIS